MPVIDQSILNLLLLKSRTNEQADELNTYFCNLKFFNKLLDGFDQSQHDIIIQTIWKTIRYENIPVDTVVFREGDAANGKMYVIINGLVGVALKKNVIVFEEENQKQEEAEKQALVEQQQQHQIDTPRKRKKRNKTIKIEPPVNTDPHNIGEIVAKLGDGLAFGDQAIKEAEGKRNASIVTLIQSEMLVIMREDFLKVKDILEQVKRQKNQLIQRIVPHLDQITSSKILEQLVYQFDDRTYCKGEILTEEGKRGQDLVYILIEGRLRMSCTIQLERLSYKVTEKKAPQQFKVKISEFDTNELIGEELLLKLSGYKYTVQVVSVKAKLYAINYRNLISKFPKETVEEMKKDFFRKEEHRHQVMRELTEKIQENFLQEEQKSQSNQVQVQMSKKFKNTYFKELFQSSLLDHNDPQVISKQDIPSEGERALQIRNQKIKEAQDNHQKRMNEFLHKHKATLEASKKENAKQKLVDHFYKKMNIPRHKRNNTEYGLITTNEGQQQSFVTQSAKLVLNVSNTIQKISNAGQGGGSTSSPDKASIHTSNSIHNDDQMQSSLHLPKIQKNSNNEQEHNNKKFLYKSRSEKKVFSMHIINPHQTNPASSLFGKNGSETPRYDYPSQQISPKFTFKHSNTINNQEQSPLPNALHKILFSPRYNEQQIVVEEEHIGTDKQNKACMNSNSNSEININSNNSTHQKMEITNNANNNIFNTVNNNNNNNSINNINNVTSSKILSSQQQEQSSIANMQQVSNSPRQQYLLQKQQQQNTLDKNYKPVYILADTWDFGIENFRIKDLDLKYELVKRGCLHVAPADTSSHRECFPPLDEHTYSLEKLKSINYSIKQKRKFSEISQSIHAQSKTKDQLLQDQKRLLDQLLKYSNKNVKEICDPHKGDFKKKVLKFNLLQRQQSLHVQQPFQQPTQSNQQQSTGSLQGFGSNTDKQKLNQSQSLLLDAIQTFQYQTNGDNTAGGGLSKVEVLPKTNPSNVSLQEFKKFNKQAKQYLHKNLQKKDSIVNTDDYQSNQNQQKINKNDILGQLSNK